MWGKYGGWPVWFGFGAVAGFVLLVGFSFPWPYRLLLGVIMSVCAALALRLYSQRWKRAVLRGAVQRFKRRERALLNRENEKLIRSIQHYRHDMLNHFQVLMGYLKLDRKKMGQSYINKVNEEMKMESRLTRLGYQPLVAYFLSFHTLYPDLQLRVKINDVPDLRELPVDEHQVYLRVKRMIDLYDKHAVYKIGEANEIYLNIHWDKKKLHLTFDFSGELNSEALSKDLARIHEIKNVGESYIDDRGQSVIKLKKQKVS